jgi:hypothetical protein
MNNAFSLRPFAAHRESLEFAMIGFALAGGTRPKPTPAKDPAGKKANRAVTRLP